MPRTSLSSDERAALVEEREALQMMLQSDGWKVFNRKVRIEFIGTGYFARMGKAVTAGGIEPQVAHRTAEEMLNMLAWPIARVNELKGLGE